MNIQFFSFDSSRFLGGNAIRPIAPRPTRPAALLLLVGNGPLRRLALLDTPGAAHSGASNYFS